MLMRIIFPLCSLAIGLWFTGCAALLLVADPPEITVVNVKPLGLQLFKQQIQIDLQFQNSNSFALDVQGIDFTLDLNGQRIAKGKAPRKITIPRYGNAILPVKTTTSVLKAMKQLFNFHQLNNMTYQIKGTLQIEGVKVPFENKGFVLEMNKDLTSEDDP